MTPSDAAAGSEVLAIEVGTSRIKLGKFAATGGCPSGKPATALSIAPPPLPEPLEAISLVHGRNLDAGVERALTNWIEEHFASGPNCYLAAVQPMVAAQMVELFEKRGWQRPRHLTWQDLPLEIRVEEPARVGIDRLLDTTAANRLREPGRAAIVVDLGTAGTVNLIAADGGFEGGAILPGMTLTAHALHAGTASLPKLDSASFSATIAPFGKNTSEAIAAGIYWGLVGAVSELIERIAGTCSRTPQLFVTGGAAPQVIEHLALGGEPVRHVPHMVLSAIRLVAELGR